MRTQDIVIGDNEPSFCHRLQGGKKMKCTICGKEHTGGVTITLLDATWYYCSSICAFKSGHSDPVKEAMINFFATKHEDAKNTEQQVQPKVG